MKELVVATRNEGKLLEVLDILKDLPVKVSALKDMGQLIDLEESGKTFEENAAIKARAVGGVTGKLTLADDSGLIVDVLKGRPGVYSARYAPTSEERNEKVLKELQGVPFKKRTARFVCVMVVYNPITKEVKTAEGVVEGYITDRPKGKGGFGYDPIFYSPELGKTFGEASAEEKNRVSHRARALGKVRGYLRYLLQNEKS
ncbi:non-canonical purine NTP pyrophosphatase, RdgB/HAM1 family [Microgenomates group bacterium RIFCSPLOWO2_01_FULL_46_13]|nr:MAG: non-canonical purine NTP pyrophosphatase, RdgB/HAM1 family [Microgenomates group bacterium RIFCSPHIGHO2_01_FULL_45_11]OGV94986.1 MAG: non-canonical purine NTP pyrophosphatase, RdgB/HAM1 family [Microgenomates group bacterium RIFCSPLOWO2_01_FULL_46_13]